MASGANISIHRVQAISVFRENGFVKISMLSDSETVHEVNIHLENDNAVPVLAESTDRCPVSSMDFPGVK